MNKARNEEKFRLRQVIKHRIERNKRKKRCRQGEYPKSELPFLHSILRNEGWAVKLKERLDRHYY